MVCQGPARRGGRVHASLGKQTLCHAELLPLGAATVIADRAWGGVGSVAGWELCDPGGPTKDSSVPGEQTSPVGDRLVGRAVCGSPLVARSPSSGSGPVTERSATRPDPDRRSLSGAYLRLIICALDCRPTTAPPPSERSPPLRPRRPPTLGRRGLHSVIALRYTPIASATSRQA